MKKEEFFCDDCGKQIKEGGGITLQIVGALSEKEIDRVIEAGGNIEIKHLCMGCYDKIFSKEESAVVYESGEKRSD